MPAHETKPNAPSQDAPSDRGAPLPHDRDEAAGGGADAASDGGDPQRRHNRKPIEQARKDVEAGVQDTERIGTPNDVPSSSDNR